MGGRCGSVEVMEVGGGQLSSGVAESLDLQRLHPSNHPSLAPFLASRHKRTCTSVALQ